MTDAPRILVVEDNPLTSKMLRITLETEGYSAVQAFDGREALAEATRSMPDLVLQDLVLPDMSGFELVRRLRALPRGAAVPIVALSGFLGRFDEARATEAAFAHVLLKPIEPSRLLDCVRGYCPIRKALPSTSARGHRLLVVDDDPVQLKLLRIHFEQLGYEVMTATSAQEAIRMARNRVPDVVVSDVLMPNVDGFQLCLEMRRDAQLAAVPVVLLSAWYQTDADRELARRVGANAFVLRTPDFDELRAKIVETFEKASPATAEDRNERLDLEHAKAVIRQLERQLSVSSGLLRRCTLQAAQISLLSGVADALARKTDTDVALRDVLVATLDAAGISRGALFLRDGAEILVLRQGIGFSDYEMTGLRSWFGGIVIEQIVNRGEPVSVAASSIVDATGSPVLIDNEVSSMEVVPLVAEGRGIGAMVLASRRTDLTSDDAVAFARAMGNQLAQSLELASSFARLAASEHRYRVLTESAHDAICVLTPDGVIREANGRLETWLGLPKSEILGHSMTDFAAPGKKRDFLDAYHDALAIGEGRTPPVEMQRANGEVVLLEFSVKAIEVNEERLVYAIGRDVTEQVRTQAQLMISDRMASVGALAAGVAHEINNPLATVCANLELATRNLGRSTARSGPDLAFGEVEAEIRDAREAADRVRQIVRDLRTFSRAEDDRRGPIDVHRVLDSSLRMATNETRHRAQVVKDYGKVPLVFANESRLGQVFLNLIVNAAQAIPEGHADSNEIRIRTRLLGPDRVTIEVCDTGSGMPPEVVKRLFTPFFTTKGAGVGTGLGLAISHRITQEFGGELTVESVEGKGTVFRVTLLVGEGEEEVAGEPVAAPEPATRRGRVLVVDDEASVGRTIRRMLSPEHDVETTMSGLEALERINRGETFDVILCDLMMPVMTGMDLHAELVRGGTGHSDRMIFLTGGAFTPRARSFFEEVPNVRLEKPFALPTLRALVNERLR